jgi:hypothetical protein
LWRRWYSWKIAPTSTAVRVCHGSQQQIRAFCGRERTAAPAALSAAATISSARSIPWRTLWYIFEAPAQNIQYIIVVIVITLSPTLSSQ